MHKVNTDTLLAVRAGRLFDGWRCLGPSTVLIDGDRIIDVDTTGATPPARAAVTDLRSDVCLLPGLIDAHVHLAFDASADAVTLSTPSTTRRCWRRWARPRAGRYKPGSPPSGIWAIGASWP